VLADQDELLLFRFTLAVFCDWHDRVGNAVEVGDALVVRMIGNDERNIASQFAVLVTVEQILKAVVVLRDKDR